MDAPASLGIHHVKSSSYPPPRKDLFESLGLGLRKPRSSHATVPTEARYG